MSHNLKENCSKTNCFTVLCSCLWFIDDLLIFTFQEEDFLPSGHSYFYILIVPTHPENYIKRFPICVEL